MPLPRSAVTTLLPTVHGARDYGELQRLGLNPDDVIDFSTNSNPYGPHPAVLQAVSEAMATPTLRRYPDRDCLKLRAAIAETDKVPVDHILPGNGATELIQSVALAFVRPGSQHLILAPTFGEYARAIHLMEGKVYEHRPQTILDLHLKTEDVITIILRLQPDTIWLCNPNNPTGQHWTIAELAHLRAADPNNEALWIIDESYRHFVDPEQTSHAENEETQTWAKNLIRLRSFTKDYCLAGLRLGYALATPALINTLQAVQPPWSVSSLAQIAGVAALQEEVIAWRQQSLAQLHQHAADLWAGLTALGLNVLPTTTTFALVAVNNAATFRSRLLAQSLLVRDCTSFGLPEHVRIAAHRLAANERLLAAIKELLA
jgi:histidinol-phosphate aminotransferase